MQSDTQVHSDVPHPETPSPPSLSSCFDLHNQLGALELLDDSPEHELVKTRAGGVLEIARTHGRPLGSELVPQRDYRPHTQSDRRPGYAQQVESSAPILFFPQNPTALGIPLKDALSSRFMHLSGREDPMFEDRGPSVSIRLNWPGYAPWSRQIPTRDFRSPPRPVTRAKLARNVAKTIKRFIDEMEGRPMEDDAEARWRVGGRHIRIEDLVLVGLQPTSASCRDSAGPVRRSQGQVESRKHHNPTNSLAVS